MNKDGLEAKWHRVADGRTFRVLFPLVTLVAMIAMTSIASQMSRHATSAADAHIYRTLLRSQTDRIAVEVDDRGVIVWASQRAVAIGAEIGSPVELLMVPEQRQAHRDGFQRAIDARDKHEAKPLQTIRCRILDQNGDTQPAVVETWTVPSGAMAWITLGGASGTLETTDTQSGQRSAVDKKGSR